MPFLQQEINKLLEEHQKLVDLFNELNDIGENLSLYDMLVASSNNQEESKKYPSLVGKIYALARMVQYYEKNFKNNKKDKSDGQTRFSNFFAEMRFSIELIETLNKHFKYKTDLTDHEQKLYKNIQQKIKRINKLGTEKTTQLLELIPQLTCTYCALGKKIVKPKNLKEELTSCSTYIYIKAIIIDEQMKQPFENKFIPTPSSDENAENIVNANIKTTRFESQRRSQIQQIQQIQQNAEDILNLEHAAANFTERQRKVNGVMHKKLVNNTKLFSQDTYEKIRNLLSKTSIDTPLSFFERFIEATKHNWKKLAFAGLALIGAGSLVTIQNPTIFVKGNFKEFINNNLISLCFWALTALALALTLKSWANGMHGRAYVRKPFSQFVNNVVAIHIPEPGKKISPFLASLLGINPKPQAE